MPTPLEGLGNRPFSFYPPLRNTGPNEWVLNGTAWDEVQVINRKSRLEVSIPSRFVGGVSSSEDPVVIVGLRTELELREGLIVPCMHRVIEMPRAVAANDAPHWAELRRTPEDNVSDEKKAAPRLAPVIGIRVEDHSAAPVPRKLMAAAAAGLLACVVTVALFRDALTARDRYFPSATQKIALPFSYSDDDHAVVSQLGQPAQSRFFRATASQDGREFLLLRYREFRFALVFEEGPAPGASHYLGAITRGGRVVHSVQLPNGQDSAALMRGLRF